MRVLAMGQDMYWLTAVQNATVDLTGVAPTKKFAGDPLRCISHLPRPNASNILLVDASGQVDMQGVVTVFRSRGWKYVIVVAADPSAKQAASVLRQNLGYDYWEKTYDDKEIRERIQACYEEILKEKQLKKRSRTPSTK